MTKTRVPMRDITKANISKAARYLERAQVELGYSEYSKVKTLCRQVLRALRRKDTEPAA